MREPTVFDETVSILGHLGDDTAPEVIRTLVRSVRVALVLPPGEADNRNARVTFAMAGNLLARECVRVDVIAPQGLPVDGVPHGQPDHDLRQAVVNWMLDVNKGEFRALPAPDGHYDVCLVIGRDQDAACSPDTIWVWSNGWNLHFRSPWKAFPSEQTIQNPIVAQAAGAFGAGEAVRRAFASLWPRLRPTDSFDFSLLEHSAHPKGPGPELPDDVALGEVALVGVGAIGSSVVLGLAVLHGVTGHLILVDGDRATDNSVARYSMVRMRDKKGFKVELAKDILSHQAGLRVHPFAMTFQDYCKSHRPARDLETLLVAVDAANKRRAIASDLPRLILNAGTDTQDFSVSRHGFGNGQACLQCLYHETPREVQWHERVALDLGLSISEVRALHESNEGIPLELVRRVAKGRTHLDEYVGQPLDTFYKRAVCGSDAVEIFGSQVIVPLPHVSSLAGSLLLVELLKERLGFHQAHTYFSWDLRSTKGPSAYGRKTFKAVRGCICSNPDYLEAYSIKWGLPKAV